MFRTSKKGATLMHNDISLDINLSLQTFCYFFGDAKMKKNNNNFRESHTVLICV